MNWVISAASFWSSSWWVNTAILFSARRTAWSWTPSNMSPHRSAPCVKSFRGGCILSRKRNISTIHRRSQKKNFSAVSARSRCRSQRRSIQLWPVSVRWLPKNSATAATWSRIRVQILFRRSSRSTFSIPWNGWWRILKPMLLRRILSMTEKFRWNMQPFCLPSIRTCTRKLTIRCQKSWKDIMRKRIRSHASARNLPIFAVLSKRHLIAAVKNTIFRKNS